MIQIQTVGNERIYTAPLALVAVALDLFNEVDSQHAICHLARRLTADDLHTTENIALNVGHGDALAFAKRRLVARCAQMRTMAPSRGALWPVNP